MKINPCTYIPKKTLKNVIFTMFLLNPFLFLNIAQAEEPLGEINIRLSGEVVAQTCSAASEDINKTVELGNWSTKQFRHIAEHSSPVPFIINLENCTGNGVMVAFTGEQDEHDNSLLSLNSESEAIGVAIEIMDINHKRIDMGSNSERVVIDSNGDARLTFLAQYVVVSTPLSAGNAYADSEFTLTYD